jgi:hypothetical protein
MNFAFALMLLMDGVKPPVPDRRVKALQLRAYLHEATKLQGIPLCSPQRCKPILGARNSRKLHQKAEFRPEPVKIARSIELESRGLSINVEQ